jgi:hypothetical protein
MLLGIIIYHLAIINILPSLYKKEIFMEDLSINKKLSRFKNCKSRFYPYIEKGLKRLPDKVCSNDILDDLAFEVISFGDANGQFFRFPNSIKNLVV